MKPKLLLCGIAVGMALACIKSEEYNGGSGKTDAGIAWPESAYTFALGADFTSPVLENPHSLAVSYSSSNEEVATISATGILSLQSVGVTTISAHFDGDDNYRPGTSQYTLTVSSADDTPDKASAELSWPESSYSFLLEETFVSPVLNNPYSVPVTYSSSNTSVAGVGEDGTLSLLKAGTTRITATFAGNEDYNSASVSYALTVRSGADDGSGQFTIPSSDTESGEDNIANTVFDRWITITYGGSAATVSGDYYGIVSINGNHVTVQNSGYTNGSDDLDKIVFELKGSASDGSLKIYGTRKMCLYLNGLNLTNPSGAVINNQCKKRTFVYVKGANTLSDGSRAAYASVAEEDCKAVLFSEAQLVFSGDGILTVNANNPQGKAGITSDDYLRFMSAPTVKVVSGSSAGHGIRGKDFVQIDGGNLDISTAANMKKGVTSDSLVVVKGGTTTVKVTGSAAYDSEDAEYTGTACIKADYAFQMSGGTVTLTNSGAGGKGIRAGSHYDATEKDHTLPDSFISGGSLTITTIGARYTGGSSSYSGNNAVTGGNLVISGGTVSVTVGGSAVSGNTISSKGIKIGYKADPSGTSKAPGGPGGPGGGGGQDSKGNEGIEAKGTLKITGGDVYVYSSSDDSINSGSTMTFSGGTVMGYSTKNDAIDANADMILEGGGVYAVTTAGSPEVALDAKEGYKLYIKPGVTLVAYGGLESGYSATQSVKTASCTRNAWNGLYNGSSYIAAFKALGFTNVSVSAPSYSSLKTGVSVTGDTYCNGYWATSEIK